MTTIKLTKSLNLPVYFVFMLVVIAAVYGLSSYPDVYDHLFVGFLVSVSSAPFLLCYLVINLIHYFFAPKHFTLDVENGMLFSQGEKIILKPSQVVKITYIFRRFSLTLTEDNNKLIKTGSVYIANLDLEALREAFSGFEKFDLSEYH